MPPRPGQAKSQLTPHALSVAAARRLSTLLTTSETAFFFALGLSGTHTPLVPPLSYVRAVDAAAVELPPSTAAHGPMLARKDGFQSANAHLTDTQRREYIATYLAAAAYVDAQVGPLDSPSPQPQPQPEPSPTRWPSRSP